MSTETPRAHHQPRVEIRSAQPYAAITGRASTEAEFRAVVDRGMPAVFRWAEARGLTPTGAPFLRYLVVDETTVPEDGPPPAEFECGVPLAEVPDGDDEVHGGVLPEGRWIVTLHRGGYSGLGRAHGVVHEWAAEEGTVVERRPAEGGTAFGGNVEHFRIGPFDEPDPWKWETDVAYLLRPDAPD
ncbi:GyrI-like domain-containing protein [Patulibacter minatonensis]|uniref:GyrI-like domain-containing protein n=1 Tax=Patulibacter minatonensis TaxID=298163 RepID=UPI0004BB600E|nr:GyrI-like domain-containing protein [Patulibacter minatonensis]